MGVSGEFILVGMEFCKKKNYCLCEYFVRIFLHDIPKICIMQLFARFLSMQKINAEIQFKEACE
jgi:hypothetical protein